MAEHHLLKIIYTTNNRLSYRPQFIYNKKHILIFMCKFMSIKLPIKTCSGPKRRDGRRKAKEKREKSSKVLMRFLSGCCACDLSLMAGTILYWDGVDVGGKLVHEMAIKISFGLIGTYVVIVREKLDGFFEIFSHFKLETYFVWNINEIYHFYYFKHSQRTNKSDTVEWTNKSHTSDIFVYKCV